MPVSVRGRMRARSRTPATGCHLADRRRRERTGRPGRAAVLACIGAGAAATAAVAGAHLALASAAAFTVSELVDLAVYQPLRRRGFIRAALASNAVGAPTDSIVFLALAGFPIFSALPGQLWARALATVVPVALFVVARALLRHRLRPSGP